jgi:hypothetical protein
MRGVIGSLLLTLGLWSTAEAQWAVELFGGAAANARSNLTIRQAGQPELSFRAEYATRPFKEGPYYAVRISRWWNGPWGAFADNLHHKLYLTNNPPEVRSFEVTYGYNMFALGPGYRSGPWTLLAGAGPVITNPTSTIRGLTRPHSGGMLGSGYYIDGVHLQVGVNRRFHVATWLFVTADLRASAGWARVDVAEGTADVPNYAVHFLVGVGAGNRRFKTSLR